MADCIAAVKQAPLGWRSSERCVRISGPEAADLVARGVGRTVSPGFLVAAGPSEPIGTKSPAFPVAGRGDEPIGTESPGFLVAGRAERVNRDRASAFSCGGLREPSKRGPSVRF